jgi:hypothetical protein
VIFRRIQGTSRIKSRKNRRRNWWRKDSWESSAESKVARIDVDSGGEKDSWESSARPSDEVMAQGLKVLTHRVGVNVVRPQVSEVLRVILTVLE